MSRKTLLLVGVPLLGVVLTAAGLSMAPPHSPAVGTANTAFVVPLEEQQTFDASSSDWAMLRANAAHNRRIATSIRPPLRVKWQTSFCVRRDTHVWDYLWLSVATERGVYLSLTRNHRLFLQMRDAATGNLVWERKLGILEEYREPLWPAVAGGRIFLVLEWDVDMPHPNPWLCCLALDALSGDVLYDAGPLKYGYVIQPRTPVRITPVPTTLAQGVLLCNPKSIHGGDYHAFRAANGQLLWRHGDSNHDVSMLAAFHSRAVDVDTFEAEIIKGGYTNAPGVMFIDLFTGHETGHNHYRTKEVLPPISDLRLNWIAPESEMYCVTTYVADCENQVLIFSGGKHRVDRRDLAVWDLFPGWDGDLYIRDLYGNCGGELRAWNAFRRQTLWVCQERIQGLQLLAGEILYGTDNQSRLVAIDTEKGQVLWRSQERGLQEAIAAGQSIYATFIRADRSGKGQVYTLSAYVPMVKEVQ